MGNIRKRNGSLVVEEDRLRHCRKKQHCPSSRTYDQIIMQGATRAPAFGRATQQAHLFSHNGVVHIIAGERTGQVSVLDVISGAGSIVKKSLKEAGKEIGKSKAQGLISAPYVDYLLITTRKSKVRFKKQGRVYSGKKVRIDIPHHEVIFCKTIAAQISPISWTVVAEMNSPDGAK